MTEELILSAAENEEPINDLHCSDEEISYISAQRVDFNRSKLTNCRFENCDLTGASFIGCELTGCTFVECTFNGAYFRDTRLTDCSASGCSFTKALFRKSELCGGFYRYANFSDSVFESTSLSDVTLAESAFIQVKFKKSRFICADLSKTDILGTPLKGMDLSDCNISGIMLSEDLRELKGARINTLQAAELIRLLDIEVAL